MQRYAQIPIDDIATFPPPGAAGPQSLRFAQDGAALAYLLPREDSTTMDLWLYDIARGEHRLLAEPPAESGGYTLEEELRRERARQAWGGITSYQIAGGTLMVPEGGRIWHARLGEPLAALAGVEAAEDPRLFPDGRRAAFVHRGELHVCPLGGGAPSALTSGAQPGLTHGLAEYAAQEELGRAEGYWIRPDGAQIAFAEVDERHIPRYPIAHQGAQEVWVEEHPYPFVGAENARVRLGSVSAQGGEPTWYEGVGEYLARVLWAPGGDLCVLWLDRLQTRATWVRYHPGDPAARTIFVEESRPWYNLSSDTRFLETGEILYSSERSGVRRLYLRREDGAERELPCPGHVNALSGLDEERRVAYWTGWDEDPTQRHLYRAHLDEGAAERLTDEEGWQIATFSDDAKAYVLRRTSLSRPPETVLRRADQDGETLLHRQAGVSAEDLGLKPPEILEVPAADGTPLYGALYRPTEPPEGKIPLVVFVYGGTHAQIVTRTWDLTVDLEAQYLAQHGYAVWRLDNRGSFGRGLAFEAPLFERFGTIEIEDQVAGVRYLAEREGIDARRVGIYGWSYGGFMTLTALLKAPDVFKAGVAGAPVTDFRWYDTTYTERYMGLPGPNEQGYEGAALWPLADRLRGDLLIIHGLVDENVHFRHSARMISALVEAGKPFEMLALPESRHSVRGLPLKRRVVEARIRFLQAHV